MKKRIFDNLPHLSKDEALNILSKPIGQLELSSDYYKAVFHLFNYPGDDTEKALLELLEVHSNKQTVRNRTDGKSAEFVRVDVRRRRRRRAR